MRILVINGGSSSIKFSLYETALASDPNLLHDGELSGIGTADQSLEIDGTEAKPSAGSSEPMEQVLDAVSTLAAPDAVGYRVVHPGANLHDHQRITPQVLDQLQHATAFAPLHDPAVLGIIHATMGRFPDVPHFACFDTVFHRTMPDTATTYPIPLEFRDRGVRRYGFHGLSCESVVVQLRATVGLGFPKRLIIAHLGGGCSVTALVDGKSVDTSMGLTPTGGIVMGTRPGDLDPGLIFYLLRQPGATVDSVEQMLNHESGVKALGGTSDMRTLRQAAAKDRAASFAIKIFTDSLRRSIAGFVALHGMDALVFTGGIGEHDPKTRWAAGNGLLGDATGEPDMEPAANDANLKGLRKISVEDGPYTVFVVPAEEDLMIARHVQRMAASNPV